MMISEAFASLAVADLARSRAWYERVFGEPTQPVEGVLEWQLGTSGGLQVYAGPERAGQGACTLHVAEIERAAQELRDAGLADVNVMHHDRVDTIMIKDPDGNSIAFAVPKS
jgi:catechol 2,3-dioxygenase-like lactoylglutathione lyase family enzyme